MGMRPVAAPGIWRAETASQPRDNDVHLEGDEFGGKAGEAVGAALCGSELARK
jgi:hypothetical protein